jgi:hypothetical protein
MRVRCRREPLRLAFVCDGWVVVGSQNDIPIGIDLESKGGLWMSSIVQPMLDSRLNVNERW